VKLVISSDHAGFPLKEEVRTYLAKAGHEVVDLGAYNTEPSDYPDFAEKVGVAIKQGVAPRGILICGSGVGVCIAANKIPGIRAGMCHDTYSAHQGVEHDDMNVVVLGARIIGPALAYEVVDAFIRAEFIAKEERFVRRFKKCSPLRPNTCVETAPTVPPDLSGVLPSNPAGEGAFAGPAQ